MTKVTPETMDWDNLGFAYVDTGKRYRAYYKDGAWSPGGIETNKMVTISESSNVLHYGQTCFEGLKAYRTKDGDIQLFRPDENAKRMNRSAEKLLMPAFPEEWFVEAVHQVVAANADWVPPYGTGASLYIRPVMFGIGDRIGVVPADEYIFSVFVMPVGPYFKGGLQPGNFVISDYDRAAPRGTGSQKVAGNYAASLQPGMLAKKAGYADAIYLDPETHSKIEEVGAANFFGITADNHLVTPQSPSILPSITKYSILHLAQERFGMTVEEGDVYVDQLDRFVEAGACGTAAVITPIGSITAGETVYRFTEGDQAGPKLKALYEELVGIQYGDRLAPEGWIQKVEIS